MNTKQLTDIEQVDELIDTLSEYCLQSYQVDDLERLLLPYNLISLTDLKLKILLAIFLTANYCLSK
jgi:hypothetical protein